MQWEHPKKNMRQHAAGQRYSDRNSQGMKSKSCCDSNEKIFAAFSKTTPGLYMPKSPLGTAGAVTSARAFGQSQELECHLGPIQRSMWAFYHH